jgi:hypothetical protein
MAVANVYRKAKRSAITAEGFGQQQAAQQQAAQQQADRRNPPGA